jgi:hypothetical protein
MKKGSSGIFRKGRGSGLGLAHGALLCWALVLAGCASPGRNGGEQPDAIELAWRLNALTGGAAQEQARLLAETAVARSHQLAEEYRAIRPPWLHNCFVQSGLKERGLCWQWADDLHASLKALDLPAFELHLVVARFGTRREHNAVGVSARGVSFADGIVLDAWRRGGYLVWADLREDKYPWYKRVDLTFKHP